MNLPHDDVGVVAVRRRVIEIGEDLFDLYRFFFRMGFYGKFASFSEESD